VETTGLDFKNDRIIEIGAVRFIDGKVSSEFSTFINPGVSIPPHITDLTGISDSDVQNAPHFPQISDQLCQFIGNLPLCGHQIEFDATFINEELKRADKPTHSGQSIDTALLSRILLQQLQRFSLKFVSDFLQVPLHNAHRALHDAKASGEIAVHLIRMLPELPLQIRQTLAACSPGSLFKGLLLKTLGDNKPSVIFEKSIQSLTISRLTHPDSYININRDQICDIFSQNGKLNAVLPAYTPRNSQLDMALGVTDALNTQSIFIAEAGTGTGKSLAYLLPSALWALTNNCRVVICTRTRNLQDQLISKDLPIVQNITGEKLNFSVLKGRNNYICLNRWQRLLKGEVGNISPRERFAILPLIVWVDRTESGDIEEQNQFNPKWFAKIWNLISAESHECSGRRCPFFQSCFFQRARQRALGSHVVVINHALFFSELCSETSFLGKIGSIVFDEAHHLESCGHRFLRVELDSNRLNLFLDMINNLVLKTGALKEETKIYEQGKGLRTLLKHLRKQSHELILELSRWALKKAEIAEFQLSYQEGDFETLVEPSAFETSISELIDKLHLLKQLLQDKEEKEFEDLEAEAQSCSEKASQLKADFQYLIAARTEEHVFWIEGNYDKGWAKLCGVPLDIGGMLSTVWDRCDGGIIFTSATLSISKSVDYFKRGVGLFPHEQRTSTGIFKSPFEAHQVIMGAVKSSPEPDNQQFPAYVAETISRLHTEINKNILVLFTSNSMLSSVHDSLRSSNSVDKSKILAQGSSGTRQNILELFKQNQGMILLGTDSFWEGIDVPGDACEIVIIPRLPFPVPTHPLTVAISRRMEQLNGESFFSYSIPEAIIKYRQGAGRLIRTVTDRGALLVLDNRIISKGYGKQFIRALDGDFKSFDDTDNMIFRVKEFFENDPSEAISKEHYVPLEDL